jgi:hypothetical protein
MRDECVGGGGQWEPGLQKPVCADADADADADAGADGDAPSRIVYR